MNALGTIILSMFMLAAVAGIIVSIVAMAKHRAGGAIGLLAFLAALLIGASCLVLTLSAQNTIDDLNASNSENEAKIDELSATLDELQENYENPYSSVRIVYADGHEKVYNVDAGKEATISIAGDEPIANIMIEK